MSLTPTTLLFKTKPTQQLSEIWKAAVGKRSIDINGSRFTQWQSPTEVLENVEMLTITGNTAAWRIADFDATKFPNLKYLYLYNNQLTGFSIIGKLEKLEILHLQNNNLPALHLQSMPNLQNLRVSENKKLTALTNLPLSIRQLDAQNCDITAIAPLLPLLKQGLSITYKENSGGAGVHLYGNVGVLDCPIEQVEKGREAVLKYFEEIEKTGFERLYEAKVLILGQGAAGKTTLIRKLKQGINAPMPTEDETTKGIDITPLTFLKDDNNYTANLWEFGGQEIYHSTHQFFLTNRSVYVLVTNNRDKNDTDLLYWLQIVKLLGGNSPILIVSNRKGDTYDELPESKLKESYNIKGFYYLNLKNDAVELGLVLKELQHQISILPQMGEQVPKPTIALRTDLEAIRAAGKKHISLEKYLDIAKKLDRDRALYYSQLLHDLGFLLHFQADLGLKNTVFLNNEWVTKGVYAVLDSDQIKVKQRGFFNEKDAKALWIAEYSVMWQEFLALMQKFDLCYELPHKKLNYIAPELFGKDETSTAKDWDKSGSLQLGYTYKFMPKGLISRLIVRLHQHIEDAQRDAWKSGVILHHQQKDAQILVEEIFGEGKIQISAKGMFAKDLLIIVDAAIDALNSDYANIVVTKSVPCICEVCKIAKIPHFYDYKQLLERKKDNKPTIECAIKPYENVSVSALLDNVFTATHLEEPTKPKTDVSNLKSTLQNHIAQGQLQKAIEALIDFQNANKIGNNEIFVLSGQLQNLVREKRKGQITDEGAGVGRSKIADALLKLIDEIEA